MLGAVFALAAPAVSADASGGNHNPAAPLTLMASSNTTVASSPPWCLTEDDSTQQMYVGSLNGTASASARLCGLATDYFNGFWYDAGGIGLESDVSVVGQLSDLAIIAPDGTAHHAVLIGQTTMKHVTTYHYAACYVPPYSISNDIGGVPLSGGTWGIAVSGTLSSATWTVNALMTDAHYQQARCPASEQNLVP